MLEKSSCGNIIASGAGEKRGRKREAKGVDLKSFRSRICRQQQHQQRAGLRVHKSGLFKLAISKGANPIANGEPAPVKTRLGFLCREWGAEVVQPPAPPPRRTTRPNCQPKPY